VESRNRQRDRDGYWQGGRRPYRGDVPGCNNSTFKTSVQNTVYNQIMAALDVNDVGEIAGRPEERKRARTKLTAAYRKMRSADLDKEAAN
jgi:hypothetical protein